jgi:hypothetical protein
LFHFSLTDVFFLFPFFHSGEINELSRERDLMQVEKNCEHQAVETAKNAAREMQKQAAKSAESAGKNKGEQTASVYLPLSVPHLFLFLNLFLSFIFFSFLHLYFVSFLLRFSSQCFKPSIFFVLSGTQCYLRRQSFIKTENADPGKRAKKVSQRSKQSNLCEVPITIKL